MDFSRKSIFNDLLNKGYLTNTSEYTYSQFCRDYFFHPVNESKRLNRNGLTFFRKFYPCYEVDVLEKIEKSQIPTKHYLFLARFCRKPYYIGTNKIVFFDEEEAFLFKMCDGDIDNVSKIAPERLS